MKVRLDISEKKIVLSEGKISIEMPIGKLTKFPLTNSFVAHLEATTPVKMSVIKEILNKHA